MEEKCRNACEDVSSLAQESDKSQNFCTSESEFNDALMDCEFCKDIARNFNLDKPVQQFINYCEPRLKPHELSSAVLFAEIYGYSVTTHTGPLPTTTVPSIPGNEGTEPVEVPDATLTKGALGRLKDSVGGPTTTSTEATGATAVTASPTTFVSSTSTTTSGHQEEPSFIPPYTPADGETSISGESSPPSISTIAIALICSIGGVILLGLIAYIIFLRRRRKQKREKDEKEDDEKDEDEGDGKGKWISGVFQLHEDSRPNELPHDNTCYEADSGTPRHELPANELPAVEMMGKRDSTIS